ncbi:MAG: 50S ribosomal protein L4 [Endomicrobium sp.]|jgi:large subunit ribosomal protein L4|nr:50S ribosomal protein L4 [Endomicrobium sp.]
MNLETIVYNVNGFESGKMKLPILFNTKISDVLLHEVVVAYLNNKRSGTHKTKSRGEVSFSGAKPWKQKGTGNARAGQRNSPLWRKGGVVFGPKPKSYYIKISKRKKRISLNMALTLQFQKKNIIVIDSISIDSAKTKKVANLLKNLKIINNKVIFMISLNDSNLRLASRNIKNVIIENAKNINTYQVLLADKLVTTQEAIDLINKRQSSIEIK